MRSSFGGVVVGHLPFTPFKLISFLTHMGVAGDNLREISYSFIFFLSSMMIRGLIQKYFKFTPDTVNPLDYEELKKNMPTQVQDEEEIAKKSQ